MRLSLIYSFPLSVVFLSGCGITQSVCMDDPFTLMAKVFVTNCDGQFELARAANFYWISQGKIPSNCSYIEVVGIDNAGHQHAYRQYINDTFQSASSGEFIISKDNEIELNWLFTSSKSRGETCEAQIDRHRK